MLLYSSHIAPKGSDPNLFLLDSAKRVGTSSFKKKRLFYAAKGKDTRQKGSTKPVLSLEQTDAGEYTCTILRNSQVSIIFYPSLGVLLSLINKIFPRKESQLKKGECISVKKGDVLIIRPNDASLSEMQIHILEITKGEKHSLEKILGI